MKARENPFRTERVDALAYRADDFSWEILETRLAAACGRGALVGPEGHGKTTLLTQWAERRRVLGDQVELLRLAFGQRRLSGEQRGSFVSGGWVFVDSAEQLGWLGWLELRRATVRAAALVVTTHRPGRLATIYACRTSPELLAEVGAELDGTSRDYEALWRRHKGNIRLALRDLYDQCSVKTETAECV